MKTVCKKLLMLMLVAMLLVAVAPAAFAADVPVPVNVEVDGGTGFLTTVTVPDGGSITLNAAQGMALVPAGTTCRAFVGWKNNSGATVTGNELPHSWVTAPEQAGYSLVLMLKAEHNYKAPVETPATCVADGFFTHECRDCGEKTVTPGNKATGHSWDAGVVVTEATCTAKGDKLFTCGDCGETRHEEIPMIAHNRDAYGECTVCHDGAANVGTLTFIYLDRNGQTTQSTAKVNLNNAIPFPDVPLVSTKAFQHKWKGTDGEIYNEGVKWTGGTMPTTFTAQYESDTTDDGLVSLEVWANYYVDGEYHHREKLFVETFTKSNRNDMFTWLYSNEGINKVNDAVFGGGANSTYQWASKIFYNYYGDAAITEASMKTDGNKAVYIKVTSKKDMEASVMLYVHLKQTETVDRVIPMPGYTAGDSVPYSAVKAAVKTKYTGSNLTVSDLYTEDSWDRLMAGQNSTGAASVKVETNGTTEIHVIVKNATNKSSSTADPSNPKTGDYIIIAVGTMALAGAALVTMAELKKRKKI